MARIRGSFLCCPKAAQDQRGRQVGSGQPPSQPGTVAGVGSDGVMDIRGAAKKILSPSIPSHPVKVKQEGECQ